MKYFIFIICFFMPFKTWSISNNFYIKCDSTGKKCYSKAILNGKERLIFSSVPENSGIKWYGGELGELHMSCGSPCSQSIFVDFSSNKISDSFSLVKSVDSKNKRVIFVSENNQLTISEIFGIKKYIIKKDFSPTASVFTAIKDVVFLSNKNLILTYLKGDDFIKTKETINIEQVGF